MKDVINVDRLIKEAVDGVFVHGRDCDINPKGANEACDEIEAELKQSLHSLLISKLPEPIQECPPDCNDDDHAGMEGYNSAIDEMRKSIDELFEVQK